MAEMVSTATQPRYATAMFQSNQPETFPLSAGVSRPYLPSAPNKATETVIFCFGKMFCIISLYIYIYRFIYLFIRTTITACKAMANPRIAALELLFHVILQILAFKKDQTGTQ